MDFFEKVCEGIDSIFDFLISLPVKIADALKWLFDLVVDAIKGIAGAIWDLFKTWCENVYNSFVSIVDFLKGIWDGFVSVMKYLFIPDSSYIDKKTSSIQSNFNNKINIDQLTGAIEGLKGANSRSVPQTRSFAIVNGVRLEGDFMQYISENIDFIHMAIRAFMFIILLRFDINKVHKLIRGTDLYEGDD